MHMQKPGDLQVLNGIDGFNRDITRGLHASEKSYIIMQLSRTNDRGCHYDR